MLLAIVMHACSSNQTSNLPPATSISACMLIASDFKFTTSNIYFSMHAHSIKFQIYHQQNLLQHAFSSNQISNLPPATSISACMLIQSDFKFTTSNICFITGIPTLRVIAGGQTLIECPMHQTFELLNCYTTRAMEQQTLISSQKAELWHGCGVSGVHGDLYGSARTCKESHEREHTLAWLWSCLGSTVICMEVHFILKKGLALWEDEITFTLFMHFSFIISPSK